MAAAMAWRMRTTSMRGRAGGGAAAAGTAPGRRPAAARSTSSRVIAPPAPVPRSVVGSMPSVAASFRASGETRARLPGPGASGLAGAGTAAAGTGAEATGTATAGPGTAAAGASSRIEASTVPVGTVAPGSMRMRSSTPLTKTSTSIRPFSVSTSAMMSPRATRSPGRLRHAMSVPAVMSAPRIGIRNSAIAAEQGPGRRRDRHGLRQRGVLHVPGVGDRDLGAAQPLHGAVQVVEAPLHDLGAHLGGEAAGAPALVDDQGPVGVGDRDQDRGGV